MCTAAAAPGMAIGGALTQLYGGITSANAAQGYHNANADYLDSMTSVNDIMANNAVDSIQKVAGMQASKVRNAGVSTTKSQRAAMASRGLSQSITYQNLLDDSISRSEMDALAIQYNADLQSANVLTEAKMKNIQYTTQAKQERAAGKIAKASGILSTMSQFANSAYNWGQTSMGLTSTRTNGSSGGYSFPTYSNASDLFNNSYATSYGNPYSFSQYSNVGSLFKNNAVNKWGW